MSFSSSTNNTTTNLASSTTTNTPQPAPPTCPPSFSANGKRSTQFKIPGKRFKCYLCDWTTNDRHNLSRHFKRAHDGHPYDRTRDLMVDDPAAPLATTTTTTTTTITTAPPPPQSHGGFPTFLFIDETAATCALYGDPQAQTLPVNVLWRTLPSSSEYNVQPPTQFAHLVRLEAGDEESDSEDE